MRKSDKSAAPRRVWRMTPEAPHGEFVEVDDRPEKADKPSAAPAPDELRESSWTRSSWDLLNGVEVTESSPGDLIEELFETSPGAPPVSSQRARASNAGEWIRRFALRLAEIDAQRDPREIIELAKHQWTVRHDLVPEDAADLEQGGRERH